jgi:hypothetical protein
VIEGENYTTIHRLSVNMGMHFSVVARRIRQQGLGSKTIKSITGQLRIVYNIKEVNELFANQENQLPIADKSGIATVNGKNYATTSRLHKLWGINEMNIKKRLLSTSVEKIQIKISPNSRPFNGYNIDQAHNVCADLITRKRRRSKLRIKSR